MSRRFVLLTWMVLGVGCVQPGAVQCDDGRTCPASFVCDEPRHGCARPEQLTVCSGKADLEPCSFETVTEGVCFEGYCSPIGCSNGVLEPGEQCDDGNRFHGDGCSADCVSNETCGNGIVDEVLGEACDDNNTANNDGCQGDCKSPRCGDGVVDSIFNEECDEGQGNSDAANATCRTNCQARRCGDGVMDSGEICDDGNLKSNDGCAFDCLSEETCGNGVVDFVRGEICDDGDTLSQDGCGACQPEAVRWTSVPSGEPARRLLPGIAYDAARGRVVMFGGANGSGKPFGDTWEWDGRAWKLMSTPTGSPSARSSAVMVYDAARKRVVLFGGVSDDGRLADTWEWNGSVWVDVTPDGVSPPPRTNHAMAYDARRKRVVLFAGRSGEQTNEVHGDTWEWNGQAWLNVTPASGSPAPRRDHAMTYDAVRGRVVLFGGNTGGFNIQEDTWTWSGTAWSNVTPASGNPPARDQHTLAFDAVSGRVVVFGGYNAGPLGDTWEWNGTGWSSASAGPSRFLHAMAYDTTRRRMVLFSGSDLFNGLQRETFERVGSVWTDVSPAVVETPIERSHAAFAYDGRRGQVVMFGGDYLNNDLSDTWLWSDGNWTRVPDVGSVPSPRRLLGMAYDAARDRVVLFGGKAGTSALPDTWEWDPNTHEWSEITPTSAIPAARSEHMLAYDAARARIVMFGGLDTNGAPLDDTWEWNGAAWTDKLPVTKPGARYSASMTYDARNARITMFGGRLGPTKYNETWRWNGTTWTNATPVSPSPAARHFSAMGYDSNRGTVVLFGGLSTTSYLNDVWEWNGTRWDAVLIPIADRPPARYGHAMIYTAAQNDHVMFGGDDGFGPLDTVWTLRHDNAASDEGCHTGIDGDGDMMIGCADADCYAFCSPLCNPAVSTCAATGPRCGDGTCQPLETPRLCPADCGGVPTVICGDFICEGTEALATCPGDCPP